MATLLNNVSNEASRDAIKEFIAHNNEKIVCVSSGGTKVPLEVNTVRSIENFSSGSRGATSAECFLSERYRVVFLYRKGSIFPFTKSVRSLCPNGFDGDFLRHHLFGAGATGGESLDVSTAQLQSLMSVERKCYNRAIEQKRLLCISYETVTEYLELLEVVASLFSVRAEAALLYCAAAVSDFYIPRSHMATHKIQSAAGERAPDSAAAAADEFVLRLSPVPKILGRITGEWCPRAFMVSFKLETDPLLLLRKARGAVANYGVHVVVANLLQTRLTEVSIVQPGVGAGSGDVVVIAKDCQEKLLEPRIVAHIASLHCVRCAEAGVALEVGGADIESFCVDVSAQMKSFNSC